MSEFPSHASPCLSPRPLRPNKPTATEYSLPEGLNNARTSSPSSPTRDRSLSDGSTQSTHDYLEIPSQTNTPTIPHSLISPAFTPPATPYSLTNAYLPTKLSSSTTEYRDRMVNTKPPKLLPRLPKVECIVRARIPTTGGAEMFLHLYHNDADNKEHLAIVFGSSIHSRSLNRVRPGETEMDRMIRGALMSEATSSHAQSAGGVIIYLRQEGRGIGLSEKLKAYNLQDLGNDTVEANLILRHPADARSYGLATAMLVDLGLGADSQNNNGIRLLTNNPDKVIAVEGPNREVIVKERVPMIPLAWRSGGQKGIRSSEIEEYLRTKIGKMGHMLE
ncbi:GTP cyclohydrolase II [Histoplasma capsulatum]|uniref:GTP cyclohydrolase II n=1 Tax=Ajellomyces capsulatus TaxID=5037 RepID=A0A8A1M086_AJECA|nr:GTP cyclohydrolase II [Histoplasma capsulatum]